MEASNKADDGGFASLQSEVDRLIKPRGYPIAFKFLPKPVEGSLSKYRLRNPLALCQVMKGVNIYGIPQLISKDLQQACADGEHVLGFREHPMSLADQWEMIFGMPRESHSQLVRDIIHVPFGENEAIIFAPLGSFDDFKIFPDGVIFNVNGIQAELLLLGSYLGRQEKPNWSYNGYAACEIVAALKLGKTPWMVIPCLGARSFCSTQDDELWFGLGIEDLRRAVEILKRYQISYPPSVEQSVLMPPLGDHLVSRLMLRPD